ncbi:hypothetical protein VTO42DRAFT_1051 [Malbranchea cinnamomea]
MSPFYLLYGLHPRIPSDVNDETNSGEKASTVDHSVGTQQFEGWEDRIRRVNHARALANELLLNRAIRTKHIRDQLVKETRFEPGTWVLVRNEGPEKFQPRWFGPYKVLKAHPLGTYALEEPDSGRVLKNLINGNRLIEANVQDPDRLWSSSAAIRALKRQGLSIEKPIEVRHIVDAYEPDPISYSELSTITKREWEEAERTGIRSEQVGEEEMTQCILVARKRRTRGQNSTSSRTFRGTRVSKQ